MKEQIDIALINSCFQGNRTAQRKLYDLSLPYLEAICYRYLFDQTFLEDVLQETYISIFKSLRQFDVNRASFKTWSTQIAINTCIKTNQKVRKMPTSEFILNLHDKIIEPLNTSWEKWNADQLLEWLKKMPENYFEVFNLYIIEEFDHNEIAQILKITPALSRQRLKRARTWIGNRRPNKKGIKRLFSLN